MADELTTAMFEGLFTSIVSMTVERAEKGLISAWNYAKEDIREKLAAREYRKKMVRRYGTIQILGQHKAKKLDRLFTEVYIHTDPIRNYGASLRELEDSFRESGRLSRKRERQDGLEFAKETERLFIWGKPGAGKTTFMKQLVMEAVNTRMGYIPIFVSLNEMAQGGLTIIDYMADQFDVCGFPDAEPVIETMLKRGKALVLFDGLDEVPKEGKTRRDTSNELRQFMDKYDQCRYVITCRLAASDYTFPRFDYVEIADFTDDQAAIFVHKWFEEQPRKGEKFLNEIMRPEYKGAREMTTSPLLLALLCLQYNSSMKFSSSRAATYEKALNVLLTDWDSSRGIERNDAIIDDKDLYLGLFEKRKVELLSVLAYETFVDGELFIKQKWLEDKIQHHLSRMPKMPPARGRLILKAIESEHGLLVERADSIYSFSHLTLQEYLTARYIIDNPYDRDPESGLTPLEALLTSKRITDSRWREVFLFVAELLTKVDHFARLFINALKKIARSCSATETLIAWTMRRSSENLLADQPKDSRLGYIYTSSARANALADASARSHAYDDTDASVRALVSIYDLARANALASVRVLTRANAFARFSALISVSDLADSLARTSARVRAYARVGANANTLARARALADARSHARALADALARARKALEHSRWLELRTAVFSLEPPDENISRDEILAFSNEIERIQRDIICQGWEWEVEDVKAFDTLIQWLNGHMLLRDCLGRAVLYDFTQEEFENKYFFTLPE